jgi:hypothetical protein
MFHGDAKFFGSGPCVAPGGVEWQAERVTLFRNKLHVGVCFSQSEAMVNMADVENDVKVCLERVQAVHKRE